MDQVIKIGDKRTVAVRINDLPNMLFMYNETEIQEINANNIVGIWKDLFPNEEVSFSNTELTGRHIVVKVSTAKTLCNDRIIEYVVFERNEIVVLAEIGSETFSKKDLLDSFLTS